MRTPVDDFALAAGFLFTEGIIKPENIIDIKYSADANVSESGSLVYDVSRFTVASSDAAFIGM